jgi:hypothetical protein
MRHLLPDVRERGAADGVLERDVEQVVLLDDRLAFREVRDREPHGAARAFRG